MRRNNWREIFSKFFSDQADVQVSFRRLEPLRLPAMHSRPVNKTDLFTIGTETSRILTAIGVLKKQLAAGRSEPAAWTLVEDSSVKSGEFARRALASAPSWDYSSAAACGATSWCALPSRISSSVKAAG
jgi:hypothetical protein